MEDYTVQISAPGIEHKQSVENREDYEVLKAVLGKILRDAEKSLELPQS